MHCAQLATLASLPSGGDGDEYLELNTTYYDWKHRSGCSVVRETTSQSAKRLAEVAVACFILKALPLNIQQPNGECSSCISESLSRDHVDAVTTSRKAGVHLGLSFGD